MESLTDTFAEKYAQNRTYGEMDQVAAFAAAHDPSSRQASLLEVRETEHFAERAARLEARQDVQDRISYLTAQLQTARQRLADVIEENNQLKDRPIWQKAHASQHRLFRGMDSIEDLLWYGR